MKLIISLLLALAPMTAAAAESDWLFLGKDGQTGASVFASKTDIAKARNNPSQARVWIGYIFNPKVTTTRAGKVYLEFNCQRNTTKNLSSVLYRRDGSNEQNTVQNPKEEYIIRGSLIQGVADQVCI